MAAPSAAALALSFGGSLPSTAPAPADARLAGLAGLAAALRSAGPAPPAAGHPLLAAAPAGLAASLGAAGPAAPAALRALAAGEPAPPPPAPPPPGPPAAPSPPGAGALAALLQGLGGAGSSGAAAAPPAAADSSALPPPPPPAKRPRLDDAATPGSDELEALKAAYLAAVDGNAPPDQCELLHQRIMDTRRARRSMALPETASDPARRASTAPRGAALAGVLGGLPGLAGALGSLLGALGAQQPLASLAAALGVRQPLAGLAAALGDPQPGALAASAGDGPCLFVEGLPVGCSDSDLRALVEQVAFRAPAESRITACKVFPGLPCGAVCLGSSQALGEAVASLHGRSVQDWPEPLQARLVDPRLEDPLAPYRLQQQLQQQLREQHAERQLQEAQLAQLASAGTSGMLETLHTLFGTGEVAQALAGVGDVKLEPAGPDEENSVVQTGLNPKKLFIGQIRRDFSHGPSLQALFEPFGQLVNFRFLEEKGVAYVEYAEFVSAKNACKQLHGKDIQGISTKVGLNVKFSKR